MTNQMAKKKKLLKVCGFGSGISLACCFGLLGLLLGFFGLTAAISYVNAYGDFIFFPSFSAFGVLFIYALMQGRRKAINYVIAAATMAFIVYFLVFGGFLSLLTVAGALIGAGTARYIHTRR